MSVMTACEGSAQGGGIDGPMRSRNVGRAWHGPPSERGVASIIRPESDPAVISLTATRAACPHRAQRRPG